MPTEKFRQRFPRALANPRAAILEMPHALIFDNDDLSKPFRKVAEFNHGRVIFLADLLPPWLAGLLER